MFSFRSLNGINRTQMCFRNSITRLYCQQPPDKDMHPSHTQEPMIPAYEEKLGEPLHLKKARLVYQSRKRGMLENGILLSSFAHKVLENMSEQQLSMYDRLINLPSNDWEIYYWATGVRPTPAEFDNEVMTMLKNFVKNEDRQVRIVQPELEFSQ